MVNEIIFCQKNAENNLSNLLKPVLWRGASKNKMSRGMEPQELL